MSSDFNTRYAIGPNEMKNFDTNQLRKAFLIKDLMKPDELILVQTHYDRYIAGSAVPETIDIKFERIEALKQDYFLERRELGIINIGGKGNVEVDGTIYEIDHKEALYVGKGAKNITFKKSQNNKVPKFYLNSAPAHQSFPTKKVGRQDAKTIELGDLETSNDRTVIQLLVSGVVETCQLQMGMTELKKGSVWNTMPAHVHDRRMEVYFYFEVPENQSVCHFMGQPQETRHIWMQNEEAVISPPWSIHAGSGTSNYTFIWGMAGENLDYSDMDVCKITELK